MKIIKMIFNIFKVSKLDISVGVCRGVVLDETCWFFQRRSGNFLKNKKSAAFGEMCRFFHTKQQYIF